MSEVTVTFEEALIEEIGAGLKSARIALDESEQFVSVHRDISGGLDRADAAAQHLLLVREEAKPKPAPTQQRAPRAKPKRARKQNGSRVPLAQRRSEVLALLGRSSNPLTTEEMASQLGTTRSVVSNATKTIDSDLLEVVKGKGRQPTKYTLVSLRDRVPV